MNIAKLAFKNLWIRSARTLLTIVGISVIIAIFFSLFSFGRGYEKALQSEFSGFGIHILAVPKGCPFEATSLLLHGGYVEGSLSFWQLEEIREHPDVEIASPMYNRHTKIHPPGKEKEIDTILYAIESEIFQLKPYWNMLEGRSFLHDHDHEIILGYQLAQQLEATIGQEFEFVVHIGEDTMMATGPLVGILDQTGTSDDNFVFIPMGWAYEMMGEDDLIKAIAIQTAESASIGMVSTELANVQDVQTVTYRQAQYTLQQLLITTRQLLNLALVFTLLLGLIGLINTMLMSIEERKKEIGMLKALGAKNPQLMQLIMIETGFIVLIGAIAGIVLAFGLSATLETGIRTLIESAPPGRLSLFSFPMAFVTVAGSVIIGAISVLLPASGLLKISPLEVIRNE